MPAFHRWKPVQRGSSDSPTTSGAEGTNPGCLLGLGSSEDFCWPRSGAADLGQGSCIYICSPKAQALSANGKMPT